MPTFDSTSESAGNAGFIVLLLIGSAFVVAFSLWLAQVLALDQGIGRRAADGGTRLRGLLGLAALGGSLLLMLGPVPGLMQNGWIASACVGSAFLGILTTMSAHRDSRSSLGVTLYEQDTEAQPKTRRKAA